MLNYFIILLFLFNNTRRTKPLAQQVGKLDHLAESLGGPETVSMISFSHPSTLETDGHSLKHRSERTSIIRKQSMAHSLPSAFPNPSCLAIPLKRESRSAAFSVRNTSPLYPIHPNLSSELINDSSSVYFGCKA